MFLLRNQRNIINHGKKFFSSFKTSSHDFMGKTFNFHVNINNQQKSGFSESSNQGVNQGFVAAGNPAEQNLQDQKFDLAIIGGGSAGLALAYVRLSFGY